MKEAKIQEQEEVIEAANRKLNKALQLKAFTEHKLGQESIVIDTPKTFNEKRKNRYMYNSSYAETQVMPKLERRRSYETTNSKMEMEQTEPAKASKSPLTPKPILRRNDTADIVQALTLTKANSSGSYGELPALSQDTPTLQLKKKSSYSILPTIQEIAKSEKSSINLYLSEKNKSVSGQPGRKRLRNPKVKDDLCKELRKPPRMTEEEHELEDRKRRRSVNHINDLKATKAKIRLFQKVLLERVALIKGKMKKVMRDYYDCLILLRSHQREIKTKKEKFIQDMHEAKKKRGFGPWELLWEFKRELIKKSSPYSDFASYRLRQVIVKGGDDLRQEMIAMQVIKKVKEIFKREKAELYVHCYDIIAIDANSGALGNLASSRIRV